MLNLAQSDSEIEITAQCDLGDPIELEALSTVFKERTKRRNYCALGSVKSNIGHSSAAAGVASIHKVLLSLKYKELAPSLHYKTPNPLNDWYGLSPLQPCAWAVDITNESNDAINRLQISNPNISWSDVQNVLIAAYCRVVSRKAGLSAAERWGRMRQFVSVLEQQIAANRLAPGTLLIASVPLPPDVFRELRSQAAASGQTTTQLMAAILTRAAGK